MKLRIALLSLLAFCSPVLARRAHAQTTTQPTPPPFVIGVYEQPAANFATWQARGINAAVEIPFGPTWTPAVMTQWKTAADAAALYQIRRPVGALAADTVDPYLLAWTYTAVGDSTTPLDEPEDKSVTPASLQPQLTAYRAAAPKRPICINFDASHVLAVQGTTTQGNYAAFNPYLDWSSSDIYPVTNWGQTSAQWLQYPGKAAATLAAWTGGKPQFALIETGNQHIGPSQQATAAQVRYQVWHSVICGVRGVIYFPQQIGLTFVFDNTSADVAAELPLLNKDLAAVGPYLAGATPVSVGPAWEVISNKGAFGTFWLIVNPDTVNTAIYSDGTQIAAGGAFATLVPPSGPVQVLAHTAIPPTVDQEIAALQAQLATLQQQLAAIQTRITAVAKDLQPQ